MTISLSQRFGPLVLQFTSQFNFRWNDGGSGGSYDGAFWHPVPPPDFYSLGSVGVSNYEDINGKVAALCVKEFNLGNGALAKPLRYEFIWNDRGSGARRNGSCWRPIPPDGYVALGDVFVDGHGEPPSLDDIRCVRKDLVHLAVAGNQIWIDRGTGSNLDFGAWEISTLPDFVDASYGLFAPNTFVGVNVYTPPTTDPVMFCLKLPLPVHEIKDPEPPTLDSRSRPPSKTDASVDHVVIVPFTAVSDPTRTIAWKLENSPFYQVERLVYYSLIMFDNNQTSSEQTQSSTVTTGISKAKSETFSRSTGISISAQTGVSFLGTGGKVTATVSVELGWSSSTSVEQFSEHSVQRQLSTPAGKAAAQWSASYQICLLRGDGSMVSQPLEFETSSFVESEFPAASNEAGLRTAA
ncbi:MAG: Vps62-related protein [Oligoflexus sp.]